MAKLELLSRTIYDANGVQTVWDFNFAGGYILPEHVKAYYELGSVRTQVTVTPASLIGPNQLYISPAVPAGAVLTIYRDTPKSAPLVDFVDRGTVSEVALDTVAKQAVFVAAESSDSAATGAVDTAVAAATSAQASALSAIGYAASAEASKEAAESILDAIVATVVSAVSSLSATLAAAGGALLIGFKQLLPGAVLRTVEDKLRESVSVKDFGAKGDGATNDTAAIVAAIAALPTDGGRIIFPSGTYITDTIVMPDYPKSIQLVGSGFQSCILQALSANKPIFQGSATVVAGFAECNNLFYGFTLKAHASGSTGAALNLAKCSFTKFENISFALNGTGKWAYGGLLDGTAQCFGNVFTDICIRNASPITTSLFHLTNIPNLNFFTQLRITGTTIGALFTSDATGGNHIIIRDGQFEGIVPATACINIGNGYNNVVVENCYFEDVVEAISRTSTSSITLRNNYFAASPGTTIGGQWPINYISIGNLSGGTNTRTTIPGIVNIVGSSGENGGFRIYNSTNAAFTSVAFDGAYISMNYPLGNSAYRVYNAGFTAFANLTFDSTQLVSNWPLQTASTWLAKTSATMSNNSGASTATLTNSPVAGNPTKWLQVMDNGVARYVPAW